MAWGTVTTTQWISRNDLLGGIAAGDVNQLTSFSGSEQWVTRTEAETWVGMNFSTSGIGADQWVTKQNLLDYKMVEFDCDASTAVVLDDDPATSAPRVKDFFYDMGTSSGVRPITVSSWSASHNVSIQISYGGSVIHSSVLSGNGTTTFTYTYNASYGTKIFVQLYFTP